MNKQDRRCLKTKKAIQDALISLITEKDYSEIRVTDIVKRADVGRKTFYLHYDNKEDVLNAIKKDLFETGDSRIRKYMFSNPQYDIHDIFTEVSSLVMQYESLLKMAAKKNNLHFFEEVLKEGLKSAVVTILKERYKISDCKTESYAEFYSAGMAAMAISWLRGDSSLSLEELMGIAKEVCFQGGDYLLESHRV
ncbi:MAG: TetR/AcrR family transcriptional regulator [Bacilli bacterium]